MTALGLTKEQMRDVAFELMPDLTDEEFEAMWRRYEMNHPRRRN